MAFEPLETCQDRRAVLYVLVMDVSCLFWGRCRLGPALVQTQTSLSWFVPSEQKVCFQKPKTRVQESTRELWVAYSLKPSAMLWFGASQN